MVSLMIKKIKIIVNTRLLKRFIGKIKKRLQVTMLAKSLERKGSGQQAYLKIIEIFLRCAKYIFCEK